jgi:hypothetical protein
MICHACGMQNPVGAENCAGCGAGLAAEPPEGPGATAFVEILTTYNTADIAFLKSLLEAEGITYFFHGENFARIDPMIQPARLMVRRHEVEKARELLRDSGLAFTALNLRDDEPAD